MPVRKGYPHPGTSHDPQGGELEVTEQQVKADQLARDGTEQFFLLVLWYVLCLWMPEEGQAGCPQPLWWSQELDLVADWVSSHLLVKHHAVSENK